jgi:hypothetical protein
MKILVATKKGQGVRGSDFNWCEENEPVRLGFECDRDRWTGPDGGCGCRRAFSGVRSHQATTTAMVAEVPDLTPALYAKMFNCSLADGGFSDTVAMKKASEEWALDMAKQLAAAAEGCELGDVVEKRGPVIQKRHLS